MTRRWGCGVAAVVLLCLLAPPAPAEPTAVPEVVDLGGEPVDPSTDAADPTPLEAGIWSDTLGGADGPEATHYFSYERTMEDSTVHVGVSGANTVASDQVELVVTTPQNEECGRDDSSSGSYNAFGTFGAGVAAGSEDRDDPCLRSEEVRISVSRSFSSATNDLPVVIRIVEEAPPSGVADLPTAPPTPRVAAPDGEESGETTGARSFDEAPYLEPGRYQTTVVEGEQRLWRVRLDWGQQLSVRLEIPSGADAEIPDDASLSSQVELVMADPTYNSLRGGVEGAEGSGTYGEEPVVLNDGSPPVAFRNRFDDVPATLPGDYRVTVSVANAEDREPLAVPMTLAVDVVGEPSGAPDFREVVASPGGGAGPEGYDKTTPYLVGEDQFSADVSGTPRVPGDDASGGPETRTLVGIVLAVVSAGLCLAGVASLRRSRQQQPR